MRVSRSLNQVFDHTISVQVSIGRRKRVLVLEEGVLYLDSSLCSQRGGIAASWCLRVVLVCRRYSRTSHDLGFSLGLFALEDALEFLFSLDHTFKVR